MAASDDRDNERTGGGGGGGGDEEEGESGGGWLTTYADMVTLMLTFFVVMVALSNSDTAKMELFFLALSKDGLTAEQFYEIQEKYEVLDTDDYDAWSEEFPFPGIGGEGDQQQDRGGDEALKELHDRMQEYMANEDLGDVIDLVYNGEFLMITQSNDILFESGSAIVAPEAYERAAIIGTMLSATFQEEDPYEIVVAGHTDNVPINTAQFPSNWHLSKDRAANYLDVLYHHSYLDPSCFSMRAYGEYRPIATNDTPEGRQANRRVEILVSLARNNPTWLRPDQPEYSNPDDIVDVE